MKIGLYFGTFNPIHIGHMAIANYMLEFTEIEQLWFVVSPQSPFKQNKNILNNYQRLEIINLAISDKYRYKACDIEFNMPIPSYTIDTLAYLNDKYSKHNFYLIMGEDNLQSLHKWKNYEVILNNYNILVYPRPGHKAGKELLKHKNVKIVNAPLIEISASFLRQSIYENKDIRHFIPYQSWKYIDEMGFYK